MRPIRSRLAAPALALGLALGALVTAPPAGAEETVHDDAAKDVIDRQNIPPYTETVKPKDRLRDLTSIRTNYADEKLAVTVGLRQLGAGYDFFVRVLVPSGDNYVVSSHDEAGTAEDTYDLYLYPQGTRTGARGGPPLKCPGLNLVRIPDKERIRVVVPRSCIGSPETVRTGALIHTFLDNGHSRSDDARRNADIEPTSITLTRVGPAVAHD